jgi:hypothetical protein
MPLSGSPGTVAPPPTQRIGEIATNGGLVTRHGSGNGPVPGTSERSFGIVANA